MRFRQYVPAIDAKRRVNIINAHGTSYQVDHETEISVVAQEIHADNRRPFYRVYPGVMTAILGIGIEKVDISKVHPPVNGLAIEFAEGHFLRGDHFEISNLMIAEISEQVTCIEYIHSNGNQGFFLFPRKYPSILDYFRGKPDTDQSLINQITQIVFGICMIPQSDTSLIKPLVLNRDKEKFAATGDLKFIDRAKRNGVHGWDVGKDIPTPEEMEAFRQQQGEPGRKSPHWRMGHFAIRHTGEGRSVPVIRWINETFVNKDLWKKVPHGYYGTEMPEVIDTSDQE